MGCGLWARWDCDHEPTDDWYEGRADPAWVERHAALIVHRYGQLGLDTYREVTALGLNDDFAFDLLVYRADRVRASKPPCPCHHRLLPSWRIPCPGQCLGLPTCRRPSNRPSGPCSGTAPPPVRSMLNPGSR